MPSRFCRRCNQIVPGHHWQRHWLAHLDEREEGSSHSERQRSSQRLTYEQRQKIIARDGGMCVVPGCFSRQDLQVHHRDNDWRNNDPRNLETLCGAHHPRGKQRARGF